MSKKPTKDTFIDTTNFSTSAFTLTFAIEVIGLDVWHDCNEGWIDLGPPVNGVKLSYQLYPGQTFEVHVVIWPHVAKVVCGINYCWVRTWQFLERRWLTFSIRHAFPVRVMDLREFEATVTPTFGLGATGTNAKSEYAELYLPRLQFGERRQFANVIEAVCPLKNYIEDLIWSLVVSFIPISIVDGPFNLPYPVKDLWHQDAVLCQVRDVILGRQIEEESIKERQTGKLASKTTIVKQHAPVNVEKKHEIKLSGEWIIAGVGRVTPFVPSIECPPAEGEVIALISSVNLPAQDDYPTFFVNVGNITDVPTEKLKENRFTHIYTSWKIWKEERNSEKQPLNTKQPKTEFNINDHHVEPLPSAVASDVMARFLDNTFRLELRGIRTPIPVSKKPRRIFGFETGDHEFDLHVPPPLPNQEVDVLIAYTKIDARALTKINRFVKGDFPLYPPETSVVPLDREGHCTNEINAIGAKVKPELFIPSSVIIEAQMTIELSFGLVGCKPKTTAKRYSRLYCLISNPDIMMRLLCHITKINELMTPAEREACLLTGFALDTGETLLLYVEGPKEGHILEIWERTGDFYPSVKPVFSTSAKYSCRLYPEFLQAAMPFNIMKMFVPLSVLLSVTCIYISPTLPLPARSAVLKLGGLIASKLKSAPCSNDMPTALELRSFRLEFCVTPQPVCVTEMPMTSVGMWEQQKPSEKIPIK